MVLIMIIGLTRVFLKLVYVCALIFSLAYQAKSQTNITAEEASAAPGSYAFKTKVFGPNTPIFMLGTSCCIGIFGRTNIIAYKPLPSEAFDAHLFRTDGKEIPKSYYGKKFGFPPKPDPQLLDGSWRYTLEAGYGHPREINFRWGNGESREWDFDVLKFFQIKEPGDYRLQVQVRLFVKDTNGVFQPFILPPVETKINISDFDLNK